jgi:hypothetical protein
MERLSMSKSMLETKSTLTKLLSTATFAGALVFSSASQAVAPGGPDCGWGNLMFEGDSGKIAHMGASIFNGTSGNQWIGILAGTNGCSSEGTITYGGKSLFALTGFMDEVAVDIAKGEGEALDALSVVMGIEQHDRSAFGKLLQNNFNTIFPNENVESDAVIASIQEVMKNDEHFSQYTS